MTADKPREEIEQVLKPAEPSDFDFFYLIKSEEKNIKWTGHVAGPIRPDLYKWFIQNISNGIREILIYFVENIPIGYVYIDKLERCIEISIAISSQFEGRGHGKMMLSLTVAYIKKFSIGQILMARIMEKNVSSQKVFISNGFEETSNREVIQLGDGRYETMITFQLSIV